MKARTWVAAWLIAAVAFLSLDSLWLVFVSPRFYPPLIGEVLSQTVDLPSAAAFYVIYITGLVILAIAPGIEKGSVRRAAVLGAVLGLTAYATYDLTNQATLKVWDIRITLADLAWGAMVSAFASAVSCWLCRRRA